MRFVLAVIFGLMALGAAAQDIELANTTCLEGQQAITDVSGARTMCFWPADVPRFGCPDDWILVTRGGAFESCTPKPEQPIQTPIDLPEPASICGEGQTLYYRQAGPRCAPTFADVGQACASSFDCDGSCLGDTVGHGVCSAGPLGIGCTDFLGPNGKVMSICIE